MGDVVPRWILMKEYARSIIATSTSSKGIPNRDAYEVCGNYGHGANTCPYQKEPIVGSEHVHAM